MVPTESDTTNAVALELTQLFKTPPNLQSLKLTAAIPQFRGIPVSAPARNHAQDMALNAVQEKLRMAMLCFVHAEEEENNADRYVGAPFLRSAHEDLLNMRCKGAAGHKMHALEPRPDDPPKSLFSQEEEKKMRGRGHQGGSVGTHGTAYRDSKGDRGRKGDDRQGKGKGKIFRGRNSSSGRGSQGKN